MHKMNRIIILLQLLFRFPRSKSFLRDPSFLVLKSDPIRYQVPHCSTFRIMRDVPSVAVLCGESIEWFPDIAYKVFFKTLVIMFWAQITNGLILHFMRSAPFFGEFTQRRIVVSYRRLGTRVKQSKNFTPGLLKIGRIDCTETSLRYYQSK